MSGAAATNAFMLTKDGIPVPGSEAGLGIELSMFNMGNPANIRIISTTEAQQLPNIPCSFFKIRNLKGNRAVYLGGLGNNIARVNHGEVIYAKEEKYIPLKNTNKCTIIGDRINDIVVITPYYNTMAEPTGVNFTDPPVVDVTPPAVQSNSPTNGATSVPIDTEIDVIFTEEIDPETITAANFSITPSVTVTRVHDTINKAKMTMIPTSDLANSTLYTIDVTGIKDLAGNTMVGTHQFSFTTDSGGPPPDTTPPTIVSKNPTPDQTNVSRGTDIVIVFSEKIQSAGVNSTNFKLTKISNSELKPTTVTLGADQKTVTMDPEDDLEYATDYRIDVIGGASGVKDLIGNALVSNETWNFTTVPLSQEEIYNVSATNTVVMGNVFVRYEGTKIENSSHPLYNKKCNETKMRARKINNPPGDVELWILNSDRSEKKKLGVGFPAANLTASSSSTTEMTFTDNSLTESDRLQVGEYLMIKYNLGDSSNRIRLIRAETDVQPNAREYEIESDDSEDINSSHDMAAIIKQNVG